MPETHNDDIRIEEEHEDSCSSSLLPYLLSSSSTEIITVPADPVPLEQSMIDKTFLLERLLTSLNRMGIIDINPIQRYGGAAGPPTVQYTDDVVLVHDADTDHTSQTLQTRDSEDAQTQDTQDTQDN